MKSLVLLSYAWLLILFPSCDAQAEDADITAAESVAIQWLAGIDAGEWGRCWDEASLLLQAQMDREHWVMVLSQSSDFLGQMEERSLATSRLANPPAEDPEGVYAVFRFLARHTRGTVKESLVLRLEGDSWRVVGYWLE